MFSIKKIAVHLIMLSLYTKRVDVVRLTMLWCNTLGKKSAARAPTRMRLQRYGDQEGHRLHTTTHFLLD